MGSILEDTINANIRFLEVWTDTSALQRKDDTTNFKLIFYIFPYATFDGISWHSPRWFSGHLKRQRNSFVRVINYVGLNWQAPSKSMTSPCVGVETLKQHRHLYYLIVCFAKQCFTDTKKSLTIIIPLTGLPAQATTSVNSTLREEQSSTTGTCGMPPPSWGLSSYVNMRVATTQWPYSIHQVLCYSPSASGCLSDRLYVIITWFKSPLACQYVFSIYQ